MSACRLCGAWGRSGGFEVGFLFPVREGETQGGASGHGGPGTDTEFIGRT